MEKKYAKKYYISLISLFLVSFVVTLGIVFGTQIAGISNVEMTTAQGVLLSLGLALVPTSSFNGFVTIFNKRTELSKNQSIALVVLIVPITILAIPLGAITLIPNIIKFAKQQ